MAKKKELNAEGEFDYDYRNDVLFFKVKNREYSHSMEISSYIIDIDVEDFVVGLQIFDASKFLNTSKDSLRQIKNWKLQANTKGNMIEVRIIFNTLIRNKIIEKQPIITYSTNENFPDSKMVCTI